MWRLSNDGAPLGFMLMCLSDANVRSRMFLGCFLHGWFRPMSGMSWSGILVSAFRVCARRTGRVTATSA